MYRLLASLAIGDAMHIARVTSADIVLAHAYPVRRIQLNAAELSLKRPEAFREALKAQRCASAASNEICGNREVPAAVE
ncbi:MAG: hypothetical protein ACKV2T_22310 [Kofleriaceae bacterium]